MYSNYGLEHAVESVAYAAMWTVVSLVIAIIGGVLVYFLFIKGKDLKLSDGLKKFRDLLDFKIMLIEPILKILYLVFTIFVILTSFNLITTNFLAFLLMLILGPVIIRIIYEASLMLVMIWKNTKVIDDKTKIETNDEKQVYKDDIQLISNGYVPIRPGYRSGLLNRWRWGIETFNERIDEIVINQSQGKYSVYFKQKGYNPPKNILNYTVGTSEIKLLFNDKKVFDFPKSTKLLQYLINVGTDADSIILDFFSGSATTAHAVMQLNAEDGGNRKFIMVQLPEQCEEKSEAYKAGYKTICEIGKERIRRAGVKIKADNPLTIQNLDTGFRVLKLDSSNMKEVFYKPADYNQTLLDFMENNIKEDRTGEDLLFQVMLEFAKPLSAKIEEKVIAGKKVYIVDDNDLICCFEENVTDEVVTQIAKLQPLYAVFRDSTFSSDSVAANFEQIFATYSPNTKRKVL